MYNSTMMLPNELLTHTFTFLPTPFIVHNVRLVNKQWNQALMEPYLWSSRTVELLGDSPLSTESIQFFKMARVSRFTLCNSRFSEFLSEMHDQVTELTLNQNNDAKGDFSLNKCTLSSLTKLSVSYTISFEEIEEFISFTPELKFISGLIPCSALKLVLEKCKKVTHFHSLSTYSSQAVIDLLGGLPLEKLVLRVDHDVDHKTWDQAMRNESVQKNLRELTVQGGLNSQQLELSSSFVLNLSTLSVMGPLSMHFNLLQASQSLHTLSLDNLDMSVAEKGLYLPNIKSLTIGWCNTIKDVFDLLFVCGPDLEDIILVCLNFPDYTPLIPETPLNLPNIKSIGIKTGVQLEALNLILKSASISKIESLSIITDVCLEKEKAERELAELLCLARSLKALFIRFNILELIPDNILRQLTTIEVGDFDDEDVEISERVLQKISACDKLKYFEATGRRHVSASNAFPRIISALPLVTQMKICNALFPRDLDMSIVHSSNIRILEISGSGIPSKEFAQELVAKLPNLTHLTIYHMEMKFYSEVLEVISKATSLDELHAIAEAPHNPLEDCHLISLKFTKSSLEVMYDVNLEDLLLVSICQLYHTVHPSLNYMRDDLEPEEFFPEPYNVRKYSRIEYTDVIIQATMSLIPSIVKRIAGITEDKRREIEESLMKTPKTKPHKIIQQLLYFANCLHADEDYE